MIEVALPFLALAGGFLFTSRCHFTRYRIARVEGERLIYNSAAFGVGLLFAAQVALKGTATILPDAYDGCARSWSSFVYHLPGVAPFAGAFLLGLALPWIVNAIYPAPKATVRAIRRYGSEFERLLYTSVATSRPLQLCLRTRKVYIGWAVDTDVLEGESAYVRILPALSGYRDEVTLTLKLTTQYLDVYAELRSRGTPFDAADFEIVIAASEVVSANLFSLDIDQNAFQLPPSSQSGTSSALPTPPMPPVGPDLTGSPNHANG